MEAPILGSSLGGVAQLETLGRGALAQGDDLIFVGRGWELERGDQGSATELIGGSLSRFEVRFPAFMALNQRCERR